ncbi:Metallo-dependent phosphatase-like protein [Diaporthe sp. PMI_573]|nr:Metallo-dependent phosphatase-like protein [Diaporthaceae sp. PMI_573]
MANNADQDVLRTTDAILNMFYVGSFPMELDSVAIQSVVESASLMLKEEPNVNSITLADKDTLVLLGDLHGRIHNLLAVLDAEGSPSPQKRYLFNGDFVDRGPFSLETIVVIICLKLQYPSFVFLNRGNHEAKAITEEDGFRREVRHRLDVQTYDTFVAMFREIPIASIVENESSRLFVVHGGIPFQGSEPVPIHQIQEIPRCREPPRSDMDFLTQALWNDPTKEGGSLASRRAGYGRRFDLRGTTRFLRENNFAAVIRSHEEVLIGFQENHTGCHTIYSANDGLVTYLLINSHLELHKKDIRAEEVDESFRWLGFGNDMESESRERSLSSQREET